MMPANRRQRYFVLIVAIFHEVVCGLNYPSIHWNYQNTRFKEGIYHLNVLPDAKVMVICPHTAISMVKTNLQTAADNLLENFWQVDYPSFQSCNVNTSNPSNKLFFKCEDPQKLQYEQFIFQSFGIGNRPTFEKGKTHYFLSTANGSKESLDRTSGGHCDEYNMRLKIYVCENSADVLCSEVQTTTPTTAPTTVPTTAPVVEVNENDVPLALDANAPQATRTPNVFERNDVLRSDAQTTTPATFLTLPVNETDGLSAQALKASQKPRTQNVFESNVGLMVAMIILGFLLLISLLVNIFFCVKMKNRKCSTPEGNDCAKPCNV